VCVMTLSINTHSQMTLSIKTLCKTTKNIITISAIIISFTYDDTQHNDGYQNSDSVWYSA
jgi:hypothetical protein